MGISHDVGAAQLRVPRCRVAVLAAVLGAAAAFASPAVADIPPVPTAPVLPDPEAIVAAALASVPPVVTPTPELALPAPAPAPPAVPPVPPQPESVPPAEPATAAPFEQAAAAAPPAQLPAAPPVQVPVEAPQTAPGPLPAPDAPPVQTVEQGVETVTQAVQQVQPVNVNISVRIDSPGDNGAVSQINAAIAAALPAVSGPDARYQAPAPQYRDPQASSATPDAPVAPVDTAPAASPEAVPTESWYWTWTWSCGDAIAPSIELPQGYLGQIWNWNWNWNCGGSNNAVGNTQSQLPSQYQPVTSQYQPINVNISIRIASPGNDGAVVQANVALAMPTLVPTASNYPASLPVRVIATPVASVEITSAPAAPAEVSSAPAEIDAAPQDLAVSDSAGKGVTPIRSVLERVPSPDSRDTTAAAGGSAPDAVVSAEAIAALAPPAPAVAAGQHAKAQEARRQAHTHRIAPKHAVAGMLSYASIGPLGAGATDRNLLPAFLFLIPFLLAFADAARRVAEEWKAEAADSGRRREKPG